VEKERKERVFGPREIQWSEKIRTGWEKNPGRVTMSLRGGSCSGVMSFFFFLFFSSSFLISSKLNHGREGQNEGLGAVEIERVGDGCVERDENGVVSSVCKRKEPTEHGSRQKP
jgi:hypothetical protein